MTYDIYSYGNGEILHGVLNALAMCLNGGSESLMEPLKRLGLLVGVFWAALYALYGEGVKVMTHWIIPMTIMMNILFVPQASVWVHDPLTQFHQKVDHVPYGLAAAAGYISVIGHTLTLQVEKVFTLPDDLKYHRSGSLFASHLIQKAKTFRITNSNMADNMRGFVEQCVVYDVMLGKYTLDDLRNSPDIWELVATHASPARSFLWETSSRGATTTAATASQSDTSRSGIVTCREGATLLDRMWREEITRASHLYSSLWGKRKTGDGSVRTELLRYLPLAYQVLGDIQRSATDILKQNMMIYAVVDAVEGKSTELGNAPNFGVRRAYLQQRSTYETLGAMAGDMLPTMKAVLEAIAYACFLFVIPMCLLPFGWTFLMRWGQILLWLQMWAPLSAVLNYVMTMAARNQSLLALGGNPEGATIGNVVALCDANADMAAMAGYLAMSLPFLSIALVKGVGSFVHLASHLGNVSQGAASVAAGEMTSGNLSYGNIHEGNVQIANTGMLQQSRAGRLASGGMTFDDGRTQTTYAPSGEVVANVGMSNLPVSINIADTQSQQFSDAASYHTQTGFQLAESSASHLASSYRKLADLSESFAHDEGRQHALNQGVTHEQMASARQAVALVRSYAEDKGMSQDQAAELFASVPFIGGKANLSSSEREQLSEAKKYAEEHHFDESVRQAMNVSRTLAESSSYHRTKRLAESITGSWDRGMSERQEASKNFSEAESYNRQAQSVIARSSTINRNASQELLEFVASHSLSRSGEVMHHEAMGRRAAIHILSRDDEVSRGYVARFMESKGYGANAATSNNGFLHSSPSQISQHYQQKKMGGLVTQEDYDNVLHQGREAVSLASHSSPSLAFEKNEGMMAFRQNIEVEGQTIQQRFQDESQKNVARRTAERVDKIIFSKDKMDQHFQKAPEEETSATNNLKGEPQQN